jgi:electron transport complex protein RnfG
MKEIIKMLVVLTVISGVCGYLLASVRSLTKDRIEEQVLLNVKGPAVQKVLANSTNDLIKDRKEIVINNNKSIVFIGKKDGTPWAFAYEVSAKGFGGNIDVMVGFELKRDVLTGVAITTHKETPGVGSKVTQDAFTNNFRSKAITEKFDIKSDGGIIDAVTGATISSRGVCSAVKAAIKDYGSVKSQIK